jgi:hypothetical protein
VRAPLAILWPSLTIISRFREESANKRLSMSTVWLSCLQRDNTHQEPKKVCADPSKARDARRKPRYPCDGKLKISVKNDSRSVGISLSHLVGHQVYKDLKIPDKWCDYIIANQASTPSKASASNILYSITPDNAADLDGHTRYKWSQ